MTVDHESIIEKKAKLQQAIRILQQLRARPLEELENDEIEIGAVMHYFTVAIEAILDMGSHILTEDFGASPKSYEDVIQLLSKKKIISAEIAERAVGMGKFRNKMIHEYADIDFKKVYTYLQKAPDEFALFDKAYSKYLKQTV